MIQADDRLKAIFDEAVKIAKAHSHEYVTLEHLLFVLLYNCLPEGLKKA